MFWSTRLVESGSPCRWGPKSCARLCQVPQRAKPVPPPRRIWFRRSLGRRRILTANGSDLFERQAAGPPDSRLLQTHLTTHSNTDTVVMVAILRSLRVAQAVARPAFVARPVAARAFSISAMRRGGAQPPELLYVIEDRSHRSACEYYANFLQRSWCQARRGPHRVSASLWCPTTPRAAAAEVLKMEQADRRVE